MACLKIQCQSKITFLDAPPRSRPPGWIIGFAFAAAAFELDILLAATRLRNQLCKLWKKLKPNHPLFLKTSVYLSVVNSATVRDILLRETKFQKAMALGDFSSDSTVGGNTRQLHCFSII
jgi:hypothetical protein